MTARAARIIPLFMMFTISSYLSVGQVSKDTSKTSKKTVPSDAKTKQGPNTTDTAKKERSLAANAALRSALIPGWGQAYNKKYWKVPIVYGALAVPVATFAYNLSWYRKCREAYNIRYQNDTSVVTPDLPTDGIDPQLKPLSTQSLKLYRNEFRKNVDFSVLAFLAVWGLNVVDAAVDGHLRSFNVSDDLSFKIAPGPTPLGNKATVSIVWRLGGETERRRSTSMNRLITTR
jgi:hypothetical protein